MVKKAVKKAVQPGQQSGNTGTTKWPNGAKLAYTAKYVAAGTFTKGAYAAHFGTLSGAAASLIGDLRGKHNWGIVCTGVGDNAVYSAPNGPPANWAANAKGVWGYTKITHSS